MGKQWRNEDIIFPEDAQRWEDGVEQSLKENDQNAEDLKKHTEDKNNPHGVTAAQAGAYTKAETDSRDAAILQTAKAHTDTHESRKNNPHGVTAAQTGAYTKAESNANDQEILTTAKQYTDEKKAEATTFTGQEVAKVKTEIQNGNVASATKLQTARTINGVAFDGTRNIELLADPQVSEIPANANLNNYKNAGFYGCRLSATAETVSNTPTTVAFSLVVLNAGNESIVTQLLSEFNTPAGSKLYIRRCYNNSWGGWHPIATADGTLQTGLFAQSASRLAAARTISLTGGVTGSVAFDGTANVSLAATVPPNSHAHTIANVTGLQAALDGKTNVRGHSNGTVTQISNANLNDIVESGVFMGSTMTNAPDTGWWYIQNMVHNANYVTQVAYRLNNADQRIRIRIKNNGTWQAWQTFMLSTDNAPTATRLATPRTISLTGGVTGSTTFDGSGNASIAATVAGNAPSATRLATPRTISLTGGATGSVSFDGSNNVSLATTLSGNAPTATRLATPRTISLTGGVTGSTTFDGSGNASIAATIAGNAPSATRLATARKIAGVDFDGTRDISISAGNVGAYSKTEVDTKINNFKTSLPGIVPTFSSGFMNYNTNPTSTNYCYVERINGMVGLYGAITNQSVLNVGDGNLLIARIPSGYRPRRRVTETMPGSSGAIFNLYIDSDGSVTISRYRGSSSTTGLANIQAPVGAWLVTNAMWVGEDI